jgi:hypothetical protein
MASLFAAVALIAGESLYRFASVDATGQLHVVLESGREILPRKLSGQVSFCAPLVSPDHRTVAWLAMYPDASPAANYARESIPGRLVIYRAGRVIHALTTDQVFWDWQFRDGGKRVAYSTGPMHGGAAECVLRDVESGHVVATWRVSSDGTPPRWARDLRR